MRLHRVLFPAAIAATAVASIGYGQVLPRNRAKAPAAPSVPAVAPAPAAPVAGETAGEVRREGREKARDVRAEAKAAGETPAEARATARETRQETRQNIQATRAADLGVWFSAQTNNQGLVIDNLTDKGVFASAGFRAGDQIVSIAGQPVTSEAQFVQFLTAPNLAGPIQVVVIRNGQRQTLVLQPTALTESVVTYDPLYQYGIVVDDSRPNQIVVLRVFPRTPAYYAGLRQGDVITTVSGQRIASIAAFTQALASGNATLNLGITRAGQSRQIALDGSSLRAEARTALRPNLDADAKGSSGAKARVGAGAGATTTPGVRIDVNTPQAAPAELPATGTRPSGTTPATPATPAPPAAPATPATPVEPAAPAATPPAPTVPATPATPATPAPKTDLP